MTKHKAVYFYLSESQLYYNRGGKADCPLYCPLYFAGRARRKADTSGEDTPTLAPETFGGVDTR